MKLVKSSPKNSPKRSLHIYKQLNIVPHCWDSYQLLGRHHTGSNPAMLYLNFSSDGSHWSDGCKCSTSVTCHLLQGHSGKRVRSNSIGKDSCMLGDWPGTRKKVEEFNFDIKATLKQARAWLTFGPKTTFITIYQVVIAQWLAWRLATRVVPGSNPGKGENLLISD